MSKTELVSSKKKRNSLAKTDDDDFEEQTVDLSSVQNNERIKVPEEDLNTVDIPTDLHEHFECVVGKHVFLDKPWTKISHKKIIDDLQLHKYNSCFWPHRKKLEGVKNGYVLVGYGPFRKTDEEFVICTTDKANQYIEETRAQSDRELKQKVERAICRVPGRWQSANSENDIEVAKPVRTRDKITYKWKLPAGRVNAKAEFQDSNSKSAKNEYVKLEPRPKETFKCSDILITDSSVQVVGEMVDTGIQTIPKMHDNKCIQSVAVEEEMFQLQPFTDSNKALDDFLEKHVPNLVKQLHYNNLYDLYRDDYKLLKNENEKPFDQNISAIKFLPGYQNVVTNKKYVSCHTWHPTISGIFAVSYMADNNALYKSVSLETPVEEITKPTVKDKKYDIVSSDDEKSPASWNDQLNLVDLNYNEKIMSLLNKEFVQRMRIIQVNDNEQLDERYNHDIIRQLRYSINHTTDSNFAQKYQNKTTNYTTQNEHFFKEFVDEPLIDESINEEYNELMNSDNVEEWNDKNYLDSEFSTDEKEYNMQTKEIKENKFANSFTSINMENIGKKIEVDHHDSDTESFYNIWGDDEEWFFGNRLRNVVRNIHRKFNKKYDRQAREHKLLTHLKAEKIYTEINKDSADMSKEKMKLAQDMFKAGDMCKRYNIKSHVESKSKNKGKSTVQRKNKYKIFQNEDESMIKREKTPLVEENNNLVIIWSISDNIFPQLRLESPEEVCCVEFNPRNGNTIVGGLTNGQICIWDIKGKLDTTDSKELNLSEKEKMHYKHLWTQMSWSIDVNFKTKIRPIALSAILESHDSMVTAIQWIHPMNEITTRGRFTTVKDHFSNQFFSASMDGTVKFWDLHSMPLKKLKKKDEVITRFGRPKNLENYESPLKIYNNRLTPSYTILITEPESDTCSPITAMSFQIPSMQYKYTSDQPFVIGKRQFEFIPTTPNETNRLLVVGNIMGQIGVVTWNGYDVDEESRNKEDCKHIWWGHVHDGPINCIRRNAFFPDIHLVCGGHVISMWSLDYKGYPIWWKRFDDFTNSVLWSTVHPAQFQVSFNTGGVLQFWDFMKCTHQPYFTSDILIGDGLIATLSTPHPLTRYNGAKQFAFAEGINEVMNHDKYELISFSDFAGTIIMITIDATPLKSNEIEDVRYMFRDEVNRRKELDEWNDKYKERFGTMGENNVDDDYRDDEVSIPGAIPTKNEILGMTQEQISRRICEENFKWYSNRKGPETRSGKMRDEYLEKEARYRVEIMMKKKNIDKKQLAECLKRTEKKDDDDESDLMEIRLKANETYKDVMKKLLAAEENKEYVFEIDSKKSIDSQDIKQIFEKIHRLLVTDFVTEKEKFRDDIKNQYKAEQEDWTRVIGNSEEDVRNYLVDKHCFKLENLRPPSYISDIVGDRYRTRLSEARVKWTRAYADDVEKRRKATERRKAREAKSNQPTKENDELPDWNDARLRKTDDDDVTGEHYERQSYGGFEGESGEGDDRGYLEYSSSMETTAFGYPAENERSVTDDGEYHDPETLDGQRDEME